MQIQDTYFLDANTALEVAKQQNRASTNNINVDGLQICYYSGNKLSKSPKNCINVPIESLIDYFSTTKNRIPTNLDFKNSSYTTLEEKNYFLEIFQRALNQSVIERVKLQEKLMDKSRKLKINFKDKNIRVFIPACRETTVMKNISKNIARAFKKEGFEVLFHIQENDMEQCDKLSAIKAYEKFNPHVTVHINHFNHDYLSEDVINFVWFQDFMPALLDNSKLEYRKRDVVFHLIKPLKKKLKEKGIRSKLQSFCIDTDIYKTRESITRENKIVFVGSSYKLQYDEVECIDKENILDDAMQLIFEKRLSTKKVRKQLGIKYPNNTTNSIGHVMNYIERDKFLEKIIELDLGLDIEVYGYNLDSSDIIKPYYKGTLEYGTKLSKVYNSAKFGLALGGYIMQQRTLEIAASGAIPLVLDPRTEKEIKKGFKYKESLILFKNIDELPTLISQNKKLDLKKIVNKHSYKKFVSKMRKIINEYR